ncbi:hypothetical protein ACLB1E_16800 [Escherichia coli]
MTAARIRRLVGDVRLSPHAQYFTAARPRISPHVGWFLYHRPCSRYASCWWIHRLPFAEPLYGEIDTGLSWQQRLGHMVAG